MAHIMIDGAATAIEFYARAAPTAAGTPVGLHVYVDDVDGLSERAVRTGAELLAGPADMFYGDRSAMLRDPFGHVWVLLTRREDLTIEEIVSRGTRALSA